MAPAEGSGRCSACTAASSRRGSLRPRHAPVTISVFTDVQCPECGEYQLEIVPRLVEDLVRPGDARLDLRHFSIGPRQITAGALATAAAAEQGAGWQFAHLMFRGLDQLGTSVDDEFLEERVAAAVPGPEFDEDRWARDRDSAQVQAEVEADAELAADLRLPAMPAVIVDGPRGTGIEEPPLRRDRGGGRRGTVGRNGGLHGRQPDRSRGPGAEVRLRADLESRFARKPLGRVGPGPLQGRPRLRVPFGHKHETQEEVYVSWAARGSSTTNRRLGTWDAVDPDRDVAGSRASRRAPRSSPSDPRRQPPEMVPGWWGSAAVRRRGVAQPGSAHRSVGGVPVPVGAPIVQR